ncbi:kinase-like domain-containing protein [Roridomyces roridus]|uniref:Kinase-like domain-containing protein n=1 Tax=Roridomyces roridus TaxID=1738132 RepID=A0AAD7BLU6_9AGAR|nr:kinase-like domain-containing protein [Roridomyces roridus]
MSSFTLPDFTNQSVDDGRFHLTEILGAGNYGVVYKALDLSSPPNSPDFYAIKCLGPVSPLTAQGCPHDEREIALHTRCSVHPNVITLYHRFATKTTFSSSSNSPPAVTFQQNDALVRCVFLRLLDVVRFFHESGISHRDLKPENILCSPQGTDIRVADFGLAIDSSPKTAGGSPSYMSPESVTLGTESESYDPKQGDVTLRASALSPRPQSPLKVSF